MQRNASTQPTDVQKLDWVNANYEGMSDLLLNTDGLPILSENLTVGSFWQAYKSIIEQAIDDNVLVLPSSVGLPVCSLPHQLSCRYQKSND